MHRYLQYVQQPTDPGRQKLPKAGFREHGKGDSPASHAVPHMAFVKTIYFMCMYPCVCVCHAQACRNLGQSEEGKDLELQMIVSFFGIGWFWVFLRKSLPLYLKLGLQMMPIYILLEKPKLKFVTYPNNNSFSFKTKALDWPGMAAPWRAAVRLAGGEGQPLCTERKGPSKDLSSA